MKRLVLIHDPSELVHVHGARQHAGNKVNVELMLPFLVDFAVPEALFDLYLVLPLFVRVPGDLELFVINEGFVEVFLCFPVPLDHVEELSHFVSLC